MNDLSLHILSGFSYSLPGPVPLPQDNIKNLSEIINIFLPFIPLTVERILAEGPKGEN